MFWELRCWSFIVVKQLTKPYTCALFKIGLSSWHVIEQSTCYKYQKKFEWKAAWGEGGECCWDYLQVLWHANAVSKSQACWKWYQDLPTISVGVNPRRSATLEREKKSSAGGNIGHGMRAKKKGCNFQGLCQANCQSFTQSYPRLWTILSAPQIKSSRRM